MTLGERLAQLRSASPSRPAVAAGVRAAIVTIAPLLIGEVTGHPQFATMALGGWLGSIAEPGGAYIARARAMLGFVLLGATVALLGTVGGAATALAVPLTFVVVSAIAMLRVYGDAGATIAVLASVVFCAQMGAVDHSLGSGLASAALLGAGGLSAAVLALGVWPVRPYDPVRGDVSETYGVLADYARGIAEALAEPLGRGAWSALAARHQGRVRAALESARSTLGATRAGRLGRSEPGELLVDLIDGADRLFELLVALAEELPAAGGTATLPRVAACARTALDALAATLDDAADALTPGVIASVGVGSRPADPSAASLDRAIVGLWEALEPTGEAASAFVARAHAARAAALVEEAATEAQQALERATIARRWRTRRPAAVRADELPARSMLLWLDATSLRDTWWAPLRANLSLDSLVMRHALRVGIAVAFATWVSRHVALGRGIWVTTTVLVLLQPYAGVTLTRGVQRVVGTVGGAIMAALLALVLRGPLAFAAAMFPLSVVAVAVRRLHYGLFTFFLTPVFVLMAERSVGDWRLALTRIASTLLGAVLALVASRLLWPSWEHERLPGEFASLLASTRSYFYSVVPALADGPSPEPRDAARRRIGLAINNAEAALQRFVGEPRGDWGEIESLASFLAQVRRVNGAMTALGIRPPTSSHDTQVARAIDATLGDLSRAVHERRAPHPLPPPLALPSRTGEYPAFAVTHDAAIDHTDASMARVAHAVQRLHAVVERTARRG